MQSVQQTVSCDSFQLQVVSTWFYTSTLTNYSTKRSIKQGRIHLPGVSGGKEIISEQDDVYIHTIQHGYQPQSHKI